ncbi:MAG: single-stranded DNA-binding protein [Defluviitaleaceae bacterium]|nr:single-stranded DNA-binding protein [Defluviitaleaceae bacterium]
MMIMSAIGRITKDFEVKTSDKGVDYAHFGFAVNEGFGNNKKTTYFDCAVFGAEAQRLFKAKARKGSLINVTGKFSKEEYDYKEGGGKGVSLRLNILTWGYIPGTGGNNNGGSSDGGGDGYNDNGRDGGNNNSSNDAYYNEGGGNGAQVEHPPTDMSHGFDPSIMNLDDGDDELPIDI